MPGTVRVMPRKKGGDSSSDQDEFSDVDLAQLDGPELTSRMLTLNDSTTALQPHIPVVALQAVVDEHKELLDIELHGTRSELLAVKKELTARREELSGLMRRKDFSRKEKEIASHVESFEKRSNELELLLELRTSDLQRLSAELEAAEQARDEALSQRDLAKVEAEKAISVGKEIGELRRTKGALSSAVAELESQREQATRLASEGTATREEVATLGMERRQLRIQVERSRKALTTLRKHLTAADSLLSEKRGRAGEITQEAVARRRELEAERSSLLGEVKGLSMQRTTLREESVVLKSQLSQLKEEERKLNVALRMQRKEQHTLSDSIREMEASLVDLSEEREVAHGVMKRLQVDARGAEEAKQQGERALALLEERKKVLESEVAARSHAVGGLEEETAALGGKLRELEKGLAKKELSLRDEGQRLFRESIRLAGFQKQLRQREEEQKARATETRELSRLLTSREREVADAEQRLSVLKRELESLGQRRSDAEDSCQEAMLLLADAQRKERAQAAILGEMERSREKAAGQLAALHKGHDELAQSLAAMEKQRSAILHQDEERRRLTEDAGERLAQELRRKEAKVKVLELAMAHLREEQQGVTKELGAIRENKLDKERALHQVIKEVKTAEDTLASLRKDAQEEKSRLEEEREALRVRQAQLAALERELTARKDTLDGDERSHQGAILLLERRSQRLADALIGDFQQRVRSRDHEGMRRAYSQLNGLYEDLSGEMKRYTYKRIVELRRLL